MKIGMLYSEQIVNGFSMQLPSMPTNNYFFFGLLLFSITIAFLSIFNKKGKRTIFFNHHKRIIGFLYISVLTYVLTMMSIFIAYASFHTFKDEFQLTSKEAIIIDPNGGTIADDEYYDTRPLLAVFNEKTNGYTDTIQSSLSQVADYKPNTKVKVYYREGAPLATELNSKRFILYFGLVLIQLFCTIGTLILISYCLHWEKIFKGLLVFTMIIFFKFILPILMIAFECLLLYAIWTYVDGTNKYSLLAFVMICFFAFILFFAIIGYIKQFVLGIESKN